MSERRYSEKYHHKSKLLAKTLAIDNKFEKLKKQKLISELNIITKFFPTTCLSV